jgi:steroid delta-isomerase-like uncharacterized protein
MRRRLALYRVGLALLMCDGHSFSVVAAQSAPRLPAVNQERNKALVRRWIDEGFNRKNPAIVTEIFLEDFVVGGQRIGRAGLRQAMTQRLAAFPDLEVTLTELLAEGNKVVIWYTARGTHRGEFEGIPATGRRVTWVGSDLLRIDGSRIVEGRFLDDSLGLLRQLRAPGDRPPAQP